MKPVFSRWEIDRPVLANAVPNADRALAPADEVARFMAANLFHCHLLAARISAKQCEVNRGNDLFSCGKCEQALLAAPVTKKRKSYGRNGRVPAPSQAAPLALTKTPAPQAVDQVRSGQVRSGQVRSGQVRSGQVRSAAAQLDPDTRQILQIMAERHGSEAARRALKKTDAPDALSP